MSRTIFTFYFLLFTLTSFSQTSAFVQSARGQLLLNGQPYYFIGTNYWYGSLLGSTAAGQQRLKTELDFLARNGVKNLRVMAGAEGEGLINGVPRVGPPLQPKQGEFNIQTLETLDYLLAEMGKRDMKAVIFFSNNWEWSGGFLQYLNWNGQLADSILVRKLSWDENRDIVSRFYGCAPCVEAYKKHVRVVMSHRNKITGELYVEDPTIMSWEIANEPRPMRPAAIPAYKTFLADVAAMIKAADKNHLLTIGAEGDIGTETMDVFESTHRDKNIDYLTIHIWPKNWGWYKGILNKRNLDTVLAKTNNYIQQHVSAAKKLGKPLVIEEFGLPRDGHSFSPTASTGLRDAYYQAIFKTWRQSMEESSVIAGCNFWAFNGLARPIPGQLFWKKGDDYMGDPPMEEQGLYGVFDSDNSTWRTIRSFARKGVKESK